MSFYNANFAKASYQQADVYGCAESANPHRLVEMLMDGLQKNLSQAKIAIDSGNVSAKCASVDKCLRILDVLRGGLNFDTGGKVATNLDDLYDYMQHRLVVGNYDSSSDIINEIISLNQQVKEAWSAISDELSPSERGTVNEY